MRKAWSTIFLLCMACTICMSGLCLAKDGNWIKYHNHDSSKYYVNPSSLKAREYEGRKYLEANVDISGTQMLLALDIENGKYIVLEGHNHVTGKTTKTDISQMSQQSPTFSGIPIYDKLIHWVEKNRPDVINEIRTHNRTAPPLPAAPKGKTDVSGPRSNTPIDPAPGVDRQPGTEDQPGGNVDVTGAAPSPNPVGAPSGSLANAVDNFAYEVLDSGAVKFTVRCPDIDTSTSGYPYTENYIFTKPERYSNYPGKYMLGTPLSEVNDTLMVSETSGTMGDAFDYDPQTQMFIWYEWYGENEVFYKYRMRVIDKNTVYIEELYNNSPVVSEASTYGYMPYNTVPSEIEYSSDYSVEYKGQYIQTKGDWMFPSVGMYWGGGSALLDSNKCVWWSNGGGFKKDGSPIYVHTWTWSKDLNVITDMARAFLAVNGNIGPMPEEFEENFRS